MFANVGKKIMGLAKIIYGLGMTVSIISGIIMLFVAGKLESGKLAIASIMVVLGGILVSWLATILLYAYGELVNNSAIVAKQFDEENEEESIQPEIDENTKES